MRLVQGERIGEMRIVGLLGEGATSEVYLVEDTRTGKKRALKLLSVHGRSHRARIRVEGEALSEFRHRNVVGVLRLIDHGGWLGVLMEYVRGPTLHRWLDVETAGQQDAATLIRGVLAGVGALHAHGLVHRDLKPGNVLLEVGADGVTPRLADFGLVKQLASESSQTQTGASMGTPAYMAPEQLRDSSRVDGRADLYSVGCIYYELLTGSPPFRRDDWWETWKAIEDGERVNLERLPTDTPAWTRALIGRLLDPEADQRPENVQAVLEAMGAADEEALPLSLATEGGQRAQRLATELDVRLSRGGDIDGPSRVSPTTLGEDAMMALSPLWSNPPESEASLAYEGTDRTPDGASPEPEVEPQPRRRFPVVLATTVGVTAVVMFGLLALASMSERRVVDQPDGVAVAMVPRDPDAPVMPARTEDTDIKDTDIKDTDAAPPPESDGDRPVQEVPDVVAPPPGPRSDASSTAPTPDGTSEPGVGEPVGGLAQATGRDGAADPDPVAEVATDPSDEGTADEQLAGGFSVEGDAAEVVLMGPDGAQYPVGSTVPPGSYRVRVRWSETEGAVSAGRVDITPGETVGLTCKRAFLRCRS